MRRHFSLPQSACDRLFGALQNKAELLQEKEDAPRDESQVCKDFGQSFLWNVAEGRAFWEGDDDTEIFPSAPWTREREPWLSKERGKWVINDKIIHQGLTWQVRDLLLYVTSDFLHAHRNRNLCRKWGNKHNWWHERFDRMPIYEVKNRYFKGTFEVGR